MQTKVILATVTCLALASSGSATTLIVDGVGGGGNYATLSAALVALGGALGTDGTPDTIAFRTNTPIVEAQAIIVNGTAATITTGPLTFGSITDALTIDGDNEGGVGDGTKGTLALTQAAGNYTGAGVTNARFNIELPNTGTYTIKNLNFVPVNQGAGFKVTYLDCCMALDEADGLVPYAGARMNIDNCVFTGSTAGNIAVDPDTSATTTMTVWGGSGTQLANSHITWASTSNAFVHTDTKFIISNCKFGQYFSQTSGSSRWSITDGVDAAAGSVISMDIINSTFNRGYNGIGVANGLGLVSADRGTMNITSCTISNVPNYAINPSGLSVNTAGTYHNTNIYGGTIIQNAASRGISVTSTANIAAQQVVTMAGTPSNPVTLTNTGGRGIRFESVTNGTPPICNVMRDVILTSNSVYGMEFNELDHQTSGGPKLEHCLFAFNGDTLSPAGQFRVADTNTVAGGCSITSSTFYRAGRTTSSSAEADLLWAFAGSDLLTYTFTNCVFAGDTGDQVLLLTAGDNNVFNYNQCAIVGTGPDAINAAPFSVVAGSPANVVNQTGTVTGDPYFANTQGPIVSDSFDIRQNTYAAAGPGGTPLTGWGDFLGGVPVSVSGFKLD